MQAAAFYGASGYYKLAGSGPTLVDSIIQCLHDNVPPVIAILVPRSFLRTGSDGRVPDPDPNEEILGGHALCVAMNSYNNAFTRGLAIGGPNQWGFGFGQDGYYWLPASYAYTRHPQYGYFLQEAHVAV
jgi:hypothetical protein